MKTLSYIIIAAFIIISFLRFKRNNTERINLKKLIRRKEIASLKIKYFSKQRANEDKKEIHQLKIKYLAAIAYLIFIIIIDLSIILIAVL